MGGIIDNSIPNAALPNRFFEPPPYQHKGDNGALEKLAKLQGQGLTKVSPSVIARLDAAEAAIRELQLTLTGKSTL